MKKRRSKARKVHLVLVESHRISYHVPCSLFIKMRILYECLANCLVDVGYGFSKNKTFYEN
jgi:hypothetical protein